MKRTDIHRPSVIKTGDYEFVAVGYQKPEDLGVVLMLAENRELIKRHMEKTGGTWSKHAHGGNCHICGAWFLYYAVFYHSASNSYIKAGFECTDKLYYENDVLFRTFRTVCLEARKNKAGKAKAQLILEENDLGLSYEIYNLEYKELAEKYPQCFNSNGVHSGITEEARIVRDMVEKFVKYGNISEKQISYLKILQDRIINREKVLAERKAEREKALDCPEGKVRISGEVVKTEAKENYYTGGIRWVMTVKSDDGYLVWGSIPSGLDVERGDKISFSATVTRSDKDPKFGFFKRPTKGEVIREKSEETSLS